MAPPVRALLPVGLDIKPPFGSAETEKIDGCATLAGVAIDAGAEAAAGCVCKSARKSTGPGGLAPGG
jgi:hypothetical protein